MNTFTNKVIIITGGASGIGRATAIEFAKAGARVIIGDINKKAGKKLISSMIDKGYAASFIHTDISTDHGAYELINEVESTFGKIDVLVNNAGIEISGPLIDCSEQEFDCLVATNLKSIFLCSKYALKGMMVRKKGAIINMASVAAFLSWPNDSVYSATKAGVVALTKGIAIEAAPYSIRVNAIAPAIIKTPMTNKAFAKHEDTKRIKAEKAALHPLGRLGKPKEIAHAILFLASDAASFITGVTLAVDGGYLAS